MERNKNKNKLISKKVNQFGIAQKHSRNKGGAAFTIGKPRSILTTESTSIYIITPRLFITVIQKDNHSNLRKHKIFNYTKEEEEEDHHLRKHFNFII